MKYLLLIFASAVMTAAAMAQTPVKPNITVVHHDWTRQSNGGARMSSQSTGVDSYGRLKRSTTRSKSRSSSFFRYELKLANKSDRDVAAVSWNYEFTDPTNGLVIRSHNFTTYKEIKSGKTKRLFSDSRAEPVDADSHGNFKSSNSRPYSDTVKIRCVLFADQTFWVNDGVPETSCPRPS